MPAQSGEATTASTTPSTVRTPPRARIAQLLRRLAFFGDAHPGWLIALIVLLYLPAALEASRHKPLWHDELYTYFLANAPSVPAMLAESRSFDLNPPLLYLATRASLHLFGDSTLATRLPEMAAMLVAILGFFAFVRRRLGAMFAFFTAAILLQSDIAQYAVEARPYALMFACLTLTLLAWQRAIEPSHPRPARMSSDSVLSNVSFRPERDSSIVPRSGETRIPASATPPPEPSATNARSQHSHRVLWILGLALAVTALLLTHVFALAPLAALLAAELFRSLRGRRPDWPVLAALTLPLAVTVTYRPLLENHGAALYPAAFQPTGETIFAMYIHLIDRELIALLLTALAVLLLLGVGHLRSEPPAEGPRWFFTQPEWFAVGGILAIPLLLMGYLDLRHGAFFVRYAGIAVWPVAALVTALLARWTTAPLNGRRRADPLVPLIGAYIVLQMAGLPGILPQQIATHSAIPTRANSEPTPMPCQACALTAQRDPSLPLVDASGLVFVEMNHRESDATLARTFYLTDPEASARIAHANIFERMPEVVRTFQLHGHSERYTAFTAQHRHFFVFGQLDYPEDWLLKKLLEDHARLSLIATIHDNYWHDTELYEVTLPTEPSAN